MILASFVSFLLFFLIIGLFAATQKKQTTQDYLLANRSVSPLFMALSSVSTTLSGFMFIGLIGMTYARGLSVLWIVLGLILGNGTIWMTMIRKIRTTSKQSESETVPQYLQSLAKNGQMIRKAAGLLTVVFLCPYAAAQLSAGSKALHVILDWPLHTGAYVGAAIAAVYCFAGGLRASIWTDAAQSLVMLFGMGMLCIVSYLNVGGFLELMQRLHAIDPMLTDLSGGSHGLAVAAFFVSWIFTGFCGLGQPHIMIRAMAMDDEKNSKKASRVYLIYYALFCMAALFVGLCCRALLNIQGAFDPELALPQLAMQYLPEPIVGMILAAIFAATISTADSQILSCSASITQDLFPKWAQSYSKAKLGTLAVSVTALLIALNGGSNVFQLVILSWTILGVSLGPLMFLRAFKQQLPQSAALFMMLAACSVAMLWRYWGLQQQVAEALPGLLAVFLLLLVLRAANKKPIKEIHPTLPSKAGLNALAAKK